MPTRCWLLLWLLPLVACGSPQATPGQPRTPPPTAPTGPVHPPGSPTDFRANAASPTAADLSWGAVPGATHYTLERRTRGETFTPVGGSLGVTAYRDTSLSPETAYTYRVRAVNGAGIGSFTEASVTTPAASAPPTGLPACSSVSFNASGSGLSPAAFTQALNKVRAAPCSCASRSYPSPVAAVGWSARLEAAALAHSQDMQRGNFFSHTGSDGSSPGQRITRQGYTWSTWGENIAAGYTGMEAVIRGWLRSTSGHCEAIKSSSYSEIGAALVAGSGNTYSNYWTLNLARPRQP